MRFWFSQSILGGLAFVGGIFLTPRATLALQAQQFTQPPTEYGEDIASNIDWTDEGPNTVIADDFVSDGRPITGVRWWGSNIGKTVTAGPCGLPLPPGTTPEGEPVCTAEYSDMFNSGCDIDPPLFSRVTCGEIVFGTAGTFLFGGSEFRDADWYEITVTEGTELTWAVTADFDAAVGFVGSVPLGSGDCADQTGFVFPFDSLAACQEISVTWCVPPGTYWGFVASLNFTGVPCGSKYVASLTCSNCDATPPSACGPANGDCCVANGTPGCDDAPCCEFICAADPFCGGSGATSLTGSWKLISQPPISGGSPDKHRLRSKSTRLRKAPSNCSDAPSSPVTALIHRNQQAGSPAVPSIETQPCVRGQPGVSGAWYSHKLKAPLPNSA